MTTDSTITTAIREALFRKAETLTQRTLTRLTDAMTHVSEHNERAVIGALAGTEADVESIRTMMMLARDCFPSETPRKAHGR